MNNPAPDQNTVNKEAFDAVETERKLDRLASEPNLICGFLEKNPLFMKTAIATALQTFPYPDRIGPTTLEEFNKIVEMKNAFIFRQLILGIEGGRQGSLGGKRKSRRRLGKSRRRLGK